MANFFNSGVSTFCVTSGVSVHTFIASGALLYLLHAQLSLLQELTRLMFDYPWLLQQNLGSTLRYQYHT